MKYIVMLGDGMADVAVPALGGRTPLEAAHKPTMDRLARQGRCGMARTVPKGMQPGSDTANLSVLGYDPKVYYRGRSPLEAVSMGIPLGPRDLALRCNLVTLSGQARLEDNHLLDYCADEIPTEEARELIQAVAEQLSHPEIELHSGISYRHCLVLRDALVGPAAVDGTALLGQIGCTPPHDIIGRPVAGHLADGAFAAVLWDVMETSRRVLTNHPLNARRAQRGDNPANACWLWGAGTVPSLTPFGRKYGIRGGAISAVDLVKGIGLCAGLEAPSIPGATGNIDTDFRAKGRYALEGLLGGWDMVYIHVEAPDESGHRAQVENKVAAIERIDSDILKPLLAGLSAAGEPCRVLLMPDHPTPLHLRTHTDDPVPFVLWDTQDPQAPNPHAATAYTEAACTATGLVVEEGHTLMDMLIKG